MTTHKHPRPHDHGVGSAAAMGRHALTVGMALDAAGAPVPTILHVSRRYGVVGVLRYDLAVDVARLAAQFGGDLTVTGYELATQADLPMWWVQSDWYPCGHCDGYGDVNIGDAHDSDYVTCDTCDGSGEILRDTPVMALKVTAAAPLSTDDRERLGLAPTPPAVDVSDAAAVVAALTSDGGGGGGGS